jgi:hypothetical protein
MSSFMDDLNRAETAFQRQADRRTRRVALAALQEISNGSPIDKGTFKANWNVSPDTIDRSADLAKTNADVQAMTQKATAVITNQVKCGTTTYISNSVPYALALENGYSPQAPEGVVEPAVTRIQNAIKDGRL